MSDDENDRNPNAEWAWLFNYFGKETLRKLLFDVGTSIEEGDEDHRVIEFKDGQALDITEHVDQLESDLDQ